MGRLGRETCTVHLIPQTIQEELKCTTAKKQLRAYCLNIYTVPKGHITLSADVIGPIFPEDKPVQLESMFPTGHGRFGKGNFT